MGLFQEFEMHPRGTHPHTRRQELMKKPPRHCITRRLARSDGCFRSARLRPLEVRAQAFINRPSVIGLGHACRRIIERVIGGWQLVGVMPHQVGHDNPDPLFLVIQHDRCAACLADAQLQRAVRILVIERHALQAAGVFYAEITMFEEDNMGRRLSRDALAHRAMTGVVVDRVCV